MEAIDSSVSWIMTGFSLGVVSTVGIYKFPTLLRYLKITSNMVSQNKKLKLVLVVRSNIMMGKGKIASQCAHAAVCCYKQARVKQPEVVNMWLLLGQPKVVLRIEDSEESVLNLAVNAEKSGLITSTIRDAGKTQVEAGTVTVVGIGPGMSDTIDKITGRLKLM